MAWKTIARSAQGEQHRQAQMPCQDYGRCQVVVSNDGTEAVIGAIADGAGSAKYSDLGSQLAVETALTALAEKFLTEPFLAEKLKDIFTPDTATPKTAIEADIEPVLNPDNPTTHETAHETAHETKNPDAEIYALFKGIVHTVLQTLQHQAQQNGYVTKDLACTLLVFFATPNGIAAMQIGDGFIVVSPEPDTYQLLFQPSKGEFINHTTFVTSVNALEDMQVKVLQQKQDFICLSTDGLEKVALTLKDWTAFPPFFAPLRAYLEEVDNPETEDEYIQNFLNSPQLNARVHDDKTLLLCLHQAS